MNATSVAEFIGAKVIDHQEQRRAEIRMMTPTWRKEGAELRKIREGLKISRREVSRLTKVSDGVYARLEKGEPIKRRDAVVQTYRTMMRCIPLMRKQDAGLIP